MLHSLSLPIADPFNSTGVSVLLHVPQIPCRDVEIYNHRDAAAPVNLTPGLGHHITGAWRRRLRLGLLKGQRPRPRHGEDCFGYNLDVGSLQVVERNLEPLRGASVVCSLMRAAPAADRLVPSFWP